MEKNNYLTASQENSQKWVAALMFNCPKKIDHSWERLARNILSNVKDNEPIIQTKLGQGLITVIFNLISPSHIEALRQTQTIANKIVSRDVGNITLKGLGVVPIDEVSPALIPSDELAIYRREKLGDMPILVDYGTTQTAQGPLAKILTFQPKD